MLLILVPFTLGGKRRFCAGVWMHVPVPVTLFKCLLFSRAQAIDTHSMSVVMLNKLFSVFLFLFLRVPTVHDSGWLKALVMSRAEIPAYHLERQTHFCIVIGLEEDGQLDPPI